MARPAGRGILYLIWGEAVVPYLDRSMASARRWHPDLPIHVERLKAPEDPIRTLLKKPQIFATTPFAETLFLDADTVVLGRLDFGFERARRFGLACTINESPWARRYGDAALAGDLVEYNTGVLFFTQAAQPIFEAWSAWVERLDSSIDWVEDGRRRRMPYNDQAGFAKAIDDAAVCPFILPLNWNYRPMFHRAFCGPIRIWHDYGDVPDFILRQNQAYEDPATPIGLHSVRVTADPTKKHPADRS